YKGICAHVFRIPQQQGGFDLIATDDFLSHQLTAVILASKPYIPVPIFGIPGWHVEQDKDDFYEDKDVFRPPRK
ncbi:MAG: DUF3025 domain-containing protein, partial [Alcaligenaceae bacterium]|nr:DUF3025 domain-containing protein [Alcaligenaceae bacterium]